MYWIEILILVQKLHVMPVTCKHGTATCFGMKSLSWKTKTGNACVITAVVFVNTACQSVCHVPLQTIHVNAVLCHTGLKVIAVSCKQPQTLISDMCMSVNLNPHSLGPYEIII